MRVLLTNDDGIEAEGLQALRRALVALPGVQLAVIAPDGNRSATARSITTRRPLAVREVDFGDGTVGYATDGTPVDCVRLAHLGLVDGFTVQLVVSGINHGANLGDDVTYSGTVAAALEANLLGLPGIAVSQQSPDREVDFRSGDGFGFDAAAAFAARVVARAADVRLSQHALLNINVPGVAPAGVAVTRLGRRVYHDTLSLERAADGARLYSIYGEAGFDESDQAGTDLAAIAAGQIAVTPLRFELTDAAGIDELTRADLGALLVGAAEEVAER